MGNIVRLKRALPFAVIAISLIVCLVYLTSNPPLAAALSASSYDNQVILVQVGNKSRFAKIRLEEVLVNGGEVPKHVNVQVSTPMKGFIVSDQAISRKKAEYDFAYLNEVALQTETDPQQQLNKLNHGTANEKDIIYAITIHHYTEVQSVMIKYRYLGLKYKTLIRTETPD